METVDNVCSQEEPFPLVEAKFRGQLRVGVGGERNRGRLWEARAGTWRSQCHSSQWGSEEGFSREAAWGLGYRQKSLPSALVLPEPFWTRRLMCTVAQLPAVNIPISECKFKVNPGWSVSPS